MPKVLTRSTKELVEFLNANYLNSSMHIEIQIDKLWGEHLVVWEALDTYDRVILDIALPASAVEEDDGITFIPHKNPIWSALYASVPSPLNV